jgi:hypothetical protein
VNSLAGLYESFRFDQITYLVYPNGNSSVALAYDPVIPNSSVTTLAQMAQMRNYMYMNQFVARPARLVLRSRDLSAGNRRWYYCNTSYQSGNAYLDTIQGALYLYCADSSTTNIRMEYKVSFRNPVSTGITHLPFYPENYEDEDEQKSDPTPITPILPPC